MRAPDPHQPQDSLAELLDAAAAPVQLRELGAEERILAAFRTASSHYPAQTDSQRTLPAMPV